MKNLPITTCVLAVTALLGAGTAHAQAPAPTDTPAIQTGGEVAAATGVEVWLSKVDDRRYDESWDSAASIFRQAYPKAPWAAMLNSRRNPLGKLLTRNVRKKEFLRSLPGTPAGQYVVFYYDTNYEHRNGVAETVSCVLDTDGQWRVCGYLVH